MRQKELEIIVKNSDEKELLQTLEYLLKKVSLVISETGVQDSALLLGTSSVLVTEALTLLQLYQEKKYGQNPITVV